MDYPRRHFRVWNLVMLLMTFAGAACSRPDPDAAAIPEPDEEISTSAAEVQTGQAVFAGGCFWCTEAVFEQLEGVNSVVSGYAGGTADAAIYEKVASGRTDHAEVIQITFDPSKITYGQILKVFFTVAHDPTQLNRQGPDTGRQYRSAIFYADEQEKRVAESYIRQLEQAKVYDKPIVTTLELLEVFYPAEAYHQDYVRNNPNHPYVVYNALPKVKKLREKHADQVKP